MSSMLRMTFAIPLLTLALLPGCAKAQDSADGSEWDQARAVLLGKPAGDMVLGIARWKQLSASDQLNFADYSGFLLSYPGFPEEAKMRVKAETALGREAVEPARIAAFFDRYPPVTMPRGRNMPLRFMPWAARRPRRPRWRRGAAGR